MRSVGIIDDDTGVVVTIRGMLLVSTIEDAAAAVGTVGFNVDVVRCVIDSDVNDSAEI